MFVHVVVQMAHCLCDQVAHYQGLIQVNWSRVQHSVESTRQTLGQHFSDNMSTFLYNVLFLLHSNCVSCSFYCISVFLMLHSIELVNSCLRVHELFMSSRVVK